MNYLTLGGEHEGHVAREIERRGHTIVPFGQALLSSELREHLKQTDSLARWIPDFAVLRDPLTLIDAKTVTAGNRGSGKYSVEMRSLLGAGIWGLPVWYVCHDFKVLTLEELVSKDPEPGLHCCAPDRFVNDPENCWSAFKAGGRALPKYCPIHRKNGKGGSGTPYILVGEECGVPLDWLLP